MQAKAAAPPASVSQKGSGMNTLNLGRTETPQLSSFDDRAMRIALVSETYPPEMNGVAMTVLRTVDFLRRRGHRVELVRPRHPGDARNDADDELTLPGLPLPMYRDLRFGLPATRYLRRHWRALRPDVVHIATEGPLGWSALRAARALGIAVTSDYRTNFHRYSGHYGLGWLERPIERYLCAFHNAADCTFVPTSAQRSQLAARGYRNLAVIGRGVDTRLYTPERRSRVLRRRWNAQDDSLVVLHVGRLAPEKNLDLAARVFEAIRAVQPHARMVWIGDGPLRRRMERQYPHHLFLGVRVGEALAACYASADVFLFPSLTETFGNVTLEAMASGLAVVAFDYGAAGEHALDGVDAFLAPYGDEAAFVQRALDLARFPGVRAQIRRSARAAVRALRWPVILGEFEQQLRIITRNHATQAALAS